MQTVTAVTIFESKKTWPFPTLPFLYLIVNSNLLFQPSPDSRNADQAESEEEQRRGFGACSRTKETNVAYIIS